MKSQENQEVRKIITLHFGELLIEDKHIFHFEQGVLGFENLKEFVLISEEESDPFKWLISVEEPNIGFPLISPWLLDINYNPGKRFAEKSKVGFVIVTLEDGHGSMTANMKAPIILDVETTAGEQIILPSEKYSTNFLIKKQ